jgi:hypothetical protein
MRWPLYVKVAAGSIRVKISQTKALAPIPSRSAKDIHGFLSASTASREWSAFADHDGIGRFPPHGFERPDAVQPGDRMKFGSENFLWRQE